MLRTPIALASSSPRRLELLRELDLSVRLVPVAHDEVVDPIWSLEEIPVRLAQQKNHKAIAHKKPEEVLLTADTIVIYDGKILHKPANMDEAFQYLTLLSDACHQVITGVCMTRKETIAFSVSTRVWFSPLPPKTIEYYISACHPFDKAGAYGIQDWIGWSHIHRIEGSYSNVMGLPTFEVYHHLRNIETG